MIKPMLAIKADLNKIEFPVLASIKFDGVRLIADCKEDSVTFYTRSGKEVKIASVEREILASGFVGLIDGEITYQTGKQFERSKISGAVNSCQTRHKNPSTDIPDCRYNVFDVVNNRHFITRQNILNYYFSKLGKTVKVAEQVLIHNADQANQLFNAVLAGGYEGLILRYPEDQYEFKRSKRMYKMKADRECVLTCIDIKPGTGKYIGRIGSLICKGTVNNRNVTVNVGSGLSDYDRWLDPSEYIGKKIEVLYNDVTEDSLFLPRFKRIEGNYDV